jgi:hypothetical protein
VAGADFVSLRHRTQVSLADIARQINPLLRGWIDLLLAVHAFGQERLIDVPEHGVQWPWAMRKFKRFRISKSLIMARIAFSAEGLTVGVNPQISCPLCEPPDCPRPELVSKEVEFDVRIRPFALSISAVHDPCFGGMQFQAAFRQPRSKLGPEGFGFLLSPAVHQPVIGIPTPREVRMCPAQSAV